VSFAFARRSRRKKLWSRRCHASFALGSAFAFDGIEEHTGEGFEIQSATAARGDQLAELVDALELERALLVLERSQLSINVARLAHVCLPPV
jgi:hypothetical protein